MSIQPLSFCSRSLLVLAVVLPGTAPLVSPQEDGELLLSFTKAPGAIADEKTVEAVYKLFPAQAWDRQKYSAERFYLDSKSPGSSYVPNLTWLDVFLDQPSVMHRYDELATKLQTAVQNPADPHARTVNAGILALIRMRQGRVAEARTAANIVLQNAKTMRSRGRIWICKRWAAEPVLDDITGPLILSALQDHSSWYHNPGWAELLIAVTNRSNNQQLADRGLTLMEQRLDKLLAERTRDEYLAEAQDAASHVVHLNLTANQPGRALQVLLRSRQSHKLNMEYVSSPIIDEMPEWQPTLMMQKATANIPPTEAVEIVGRGLVGSEKQLTGLLPLTGLGSSMSNRIELDAYAAKDQQAEFLQSLAQWLENKLEDSSQLSQNQTHNARIALVVVRLKQKKSELARAAAMPLLESFDLSDLSAFAWRDAGTSPDATQVLQTVLPLWWTLSHAPTELLEKAPFPTIAEACLITAGQACVRAHECMRGSLREKANSSPVISALLRKHEQPRPDAPKAHRDLTVFDDFMWAHAKSLLSLGDAAAAKNNPKRRDEAFSANLFRYRRSSLRNPSEVDAIENQWVGLGKPRESFAEQLLEMLIDTTDETGIRSGSSGASGVGWALAEPWTDEAEYLPTAFSLWPDLMRRRLKSITTEQLKQRITADDTTTQQWQEFWLQLALADATENESDFNHFARKLQEIAPTVTGRARGQLVGEVFALSRTDQHTPAIEAILAAFVAGLSESERRNPQDWPLLAQMSQFRIALRSGDIGAIDAAQAPFEAAMLAWNDTISCGHTPAGYTMARMSLAAIKCNHFERGGRLLALAFPKMRQAGQWNMWRHVTKLLASVEPQQRYEFHLGFSVTSSRGVNPWFWDPQDPSKDGLCSPRPKPIEVPKYPTNVAIAWRELLTAAEEADQLQNLGRQLLQLRRTLTDAKDNVQNRLFRLARLTRARRTDGDAASASVKNLVDRLMAGTPRQSLDYITILLLHDHKSTREAALQVLAKWLSRTDLITNNNSAERMARLGGWLVEATPEEPGLQNTQWRTEVAGVPGQQTAAFRWQVTESSTPKQATDLVRNSGPRGEHVEWANKAAGDFTLEATIEPKHASRVWLRWGTLYFGFRNPTMEEDRQRPGYGRIQHDEGGAFLAARAFDGAHDMTQARLLSELRLTEPLKAARLRLARIGNRLRFEVNDQRFLEVAIEGQPAPAKVGFYFPDIGHAALNQVRLDIKPGQQTSTTQDPVTYIPIRVNHIGYRGDMITRQLFR